MFLRDTTKLPLPQGRSYRTRLSGFIIERSTFGPTSIPWKTDGVRKTSSKKLVPYGCRLYVCLTWFTTKLVRTLHKGRRVTEALRRAMGIYSAPSTEARVLFLGVEPAKNHSLGYSSSADKREYLSWKVSEAGTLVANRTQLGSQVFIVLCPFACSDEW